jgi:hypothetical protein
MKRLGDISGYGYVPWSGDGASFWPTSRHALIGTPSKEGPVDEPKDATLTDDDVSTEYGSERTGWTSVEADADDTDTTDADADDADQDADADDPSL